MEEALICAGVEVVLAETAENFAEVEFVLFFVVGVDEDVVQID